MKNRNQVYRKVRKSYASVIIIIFCLFVGVSSLTAGPTDTTVPIWIIGDSTVSEYSESDAHRGWGQVIGEFLKNGDRVDNRARSGASSKSYIPIIDQWSTNCFWGDGSTNSQYDRSGLKEDIANADTSNGGYLFIQFGHNDCFETLYTTDKSTVPGIDNEFDSYIMEYVDFAKSHNITPVLITPMARMFVTLLNDVYFHRVDPLPECPAPWEDMTGEVGDWPQTLREIGAREGVIVLDLTTKSKEFFATFPNDQAIKDEYSWDGNDATHFNEAGAEKMVEFIRELAIQADSALAGQFLGVQPPVEVPVGWDTYDNPDDIATITSVVDPDDPLNQVIYLQSNGVSCGFRYTIPDDETENFTLIWRMKYSEHYNIYVSCNTTDGHRYIQYRPMDFNILDDSEIIHGLGSDTMNGNWISFSRDLQADLHAAQPDVDIIKVNEFLISSASGYIDDLKFSDTQSPGEIWHSADTNNDWNISQTEVNAFIANYANNSNTVSEGNGSFDDANRITMREVLRVIYLYNDGGDYKEATGTVDDYDIDGTTVPPGPIFPPSNPTNASDFFSNISESAAVTYEFSGATDTDGQVVSYVIDQISSSEISIPMTVRSPEEEFTMGVNGDITQDVPVSFRVRALDNDGNYSSGVSVQTTLIADGATPPLTDYQQLLNDAASGSANVTYIISGDSTRNNDFNFMISYYESQFAKINVTVVNNASSGLDAKDWNANVRANASLENAIQKSAGEGENTIMEYSLGINDQGRGTSRIEQKERYKTGIIAYLTAKPAAIVILVVPVAHSSDEPNNELRDIYQEIAQELNLPLVDALEITEGVHGDSAYYNDGTHPNQWGSRRVVNYIMDQILPPELYSVVTLEEAANQPAPFDNELSNGVEQGLYSDSTGFMGTPVNYSGAWRLKEIPIEPNFILKIKTGGSRNEAFFMNAAGECAHDINLGARGNREYIAVVIPPDGVALRLTLSIDDPDYNPENDDFSVKYDVNNINFMSIDDINAGLNIRLEKM